MNERTYELTVSGLTEAEAKDAYARAIGVLPDDLLPTGPTYSANLRSNHLIFPTSVMPSRAAIKITPEDSP